MPAANHSLPTEMGFFKPLSHFANGIGCTSRPNVWKRFEATPGTYPLLRERLLASRQASSDHWTAEDAAMWPQVNEVAEQHLHAALAGLVDAPAAEVRRELLRLEAEHASRRHSVWTKLGESPLALSLEHLAALAHGSGLPLPGSTPQELAQAYAQSGHQMDRAALQALQVMRTDAQRELIGRAPLTWSGWNG